MTTVKIVAIIVSRSAIQARLPRAMSRGEIGVAYIAWKIRCHSSPADDRERRLERRRLHRGRGEQARARGTRGSVTPPSAASASDVDVAPEPDAHRRQEQDRRQERREDRGAERAPVLEQPVLEDPADGDRRRAAIDGHRRYSISERPVSRRNTSSSVDRRTSDGLRARGRARGRPRRPPRRRRRRAGRGRAGARSRSARPSSWPSSVSCDAGGEAQLGHLAGRVALDQLARRALGDDLRLVHDHEPVAQLLGLVHVVGRQDERHAALLEPVEPVPQQVAGLRVEAGRRLVEQQQRRAR